MTLTDSGPLCALIDRRDRNHEACSAARKRMRLPLVTTDAVLTEAMHFANGHVGWPGQAALWRIVRDGVLSVVPITDDMRMQMAGWMERYRDLPMDYADASLLAVAEARGMDTIFSIDSDFHVYRLRNGKTLRVVP